LSLHAPHNFEARAANDNDFAAVHYGTPCLGKSAPPEHLLRAALRYFSEHGLGAARAARKQAECAFFNGDRAGYDHWLAITRTLDRRLALEAERIADRRQQHET